MSRATFRSTERRPSPPLLTALAPLLLALSAPSTLLAAAAEPSELEGEWRCEGGDDRVGFDSTWTLDPSEEYSDASRVTSREDIDGDGRPDEIVLESVERGRWSLTEAGDLRFHVHGVEILAMSVNGAETPLEEALAATEQMTAAAVGRVIEIPLEGLSEAGFETRVSGLATRCRR